MTSSSVKLTVVCAAVGCPSRAVFTASSVEAAWAKALRWGWRRVSLSQPLCADHAASQVYQEWLSDRLRGD